MRGGSRTDRMRVAARINLLLLLALGVLLDSVCSEGAEPSASPVSKDTVPVTSTTAVMPEEAGKTTVVPTGSNPMAAATSTTRPSEGAAQTKEPTPPPTTAKQEDAAPSPAATATATPAPTVRPVSTTQQAAALPSTPAVPDSTTAAAATTAAPAPATTSRPPKDPALATTAGSSGPLGGSTTAAATAAPMEGVTTTVPVTDVVGSGRTMTPAVSTAAPTLEHRLSTRSSITSTQEHNKRATVAAGNPESTTKPTGTTGSAGTTGSRSSTSLTKTDPPATDTTAAKAGGVPHPTRAFPSTHGPATSTGTAAMTTTTVMSQPQMFLYSLNKKHENKEEKDLVEVCRRLLANMQDGNCTLVWQQRNGKIHFDCVEINGKVKTKLATEYYEEITKKPTDNKTLIAILASCGGLLIMIVILAVCASHRRKPYNENQQHLTEELHTVENGYHDNPTLEVMEVQPEMQEKKMALNGEFNDSWIVPIDNLMKDDVPDEEDTHL